MPIWGIRTSIIALVTFSMVSLGQITDAAHYPLVARSAVASHLPSTPAYRSGAVVQDLAVMHRQKRSHTVNVIVDSPSRVLQLDRYAAATANPKSALFHHFLSPSTLDHRFGPSATMMGSAEAAMRRAGWDVLGHQGLVVTAKVPGRSQHPGLAVSPDIWSITGFTRHGLLRPSAPLTSYPRPVPKRSGQFKAAASSTNPDFSLSAENFNQQPIVLQQTTESNGDVVSVMSWNPLVQSSVPAGLPINLFVTVEDPQGNFLPITNVGNLNDSQSSLVSYGTSAMPFSSNTLWQMPIAAWKDIAPGDLLTLTVTIAGGAALNASFPLPSFTGSATVLTPLDGQQVNTLSGIGTMPSNPGAIALFAIGAPPSLKNLSSYLAQNSTQVTPPTVTFHYENGATPNEYGQSADSEESQLDLEATAGAAPGAPIEDYIFPENDTQDPLISYLTALSQQSTAKIANLSYGFFGENPATLTTLMNALTAEGITVLEASGDQGAWNGGSDPGPVGLSSLEQIPQVVSVGGTDVAAQARTNSGGNTLTLSGSIISDAWGGDFLNGIPVAVAQAYTNENAASSGGYSTQTPTPSWQQAFLPSGASGFGVPIIASMAGFPGLSGYLGGQNVVFGGTSLASPLTAGWLDEAEAALNLGSTGLGDINPLLFQAATSDPSLYNQALWGQDGVYSITNPAPGTWNPLTGLGMLNWGGFIQDYSQLVPETGKALSLAIPGSASLGQRIQAQAYSRGTLNPLYQFSVQSPQHNGATFSGPYTSKATFSFTPKVPGTYRVTVTAKSASGTTLRANKTLVITTHAPMISALALRAFPPWPNLALHRVLIINATAQDIGHHPEYQVTLQGTHMRPHIVRGWSPRARFIEKPLPPGHYVITVYALDQVQIKHHNWATAFRRTHAFMVH